MKCESCSYKKYALTYELARKFSSELQKGDCILLNGSLGVGKTQFIKNIARALQVEVPVTSPTYGLVHFYPTSTLNIIHIDAYRLSSIQEFYDLGLEEFFDSHVTFIEWGDKVKIAFDIYVQINLAFEQEDNMCRSANIELFTFDESSIRAKRWTHFINNVI